VDEEMRGSTGAGVSICRGATTEVNLRKSRSNKLKIVINDRKVKSARVSELVVEEFLGRAGVTYDVFVDHHIDVPIGHGFGSSGAGALSLALALNEALELNLGRFEAAAIAHAAEVKCKTGLGTVITETVGGLEVRVKPGAPGVGRVLNIPLHDTYVAVCVPLGRISTRNVLSDSTLRRRIQMGGRLVNKLLSDPSVENFMTLSRTFAEHVGLISKRLRVLLTQADEAGITCSMAMIGETLFTLATPHQLREINSIFRRPLNGRGMIISEIDFRGARVL
jgi:pantoate kinase